jgi:hypothetical protein
VHGDVGFVQQHGALNLDGERALTPERGEIDVFLSITPSFNKYELALDAKFGETLLYEP